LIINIEVGAVDEKKWLLDHEQNQTKLKKFSLMDFNFENGLWCVNTFTRFEGLNKGFNIPIIFLVS